MADYEQQPEPHVTSERTIVPPVNGMELTERVKTDCEMVGYDLVDGIVDAISPIHDSKGADITEKAKGQLENAWRETFKYTLNHQRASAHPHQRPVAEEAKNSLELIRRLQNSRDTMSAMMNREGIQLGSWSTARQTLHTEVMNRYDGMIASLVHTVWGHHVAPDAPQHQR